MILSREVGLLLKGRCPGSLQGYIFVSVVGSNGTILSVEACRDKFLSSNFPTLAALF